MNTRRRENIRREAERDASGAGVERGARVLRVRRQGTGGNFEGHGERNSSSFYHFPVFVLPGSIGNRGRLVGIAFAEENSSVPQFLTIFMSAELTKWILNFLVFLVKIK